ncbi:MAG: hypothetical protein QOK21_75 [Solirubrobacteraceae bacterium]|jgi:signal transduction histidine kinase|nr:hypothetical protein [Solirubrobacteraceae bacterium]
MTADHPPHRALLTEASLVLAVAVGLGVTVLVSLTDVLHFAYRSPTLHVAVETTAAFASIVAAQSIYGRYRSTLELRGLVLTAALVMFAANNLLLSALPAVLSGEPGAFRTWAPVCGQLSATVLLAAAAWLPRRPLRRPRLAAWRALIGCGVLLIVIPAAVTAAGDALPAAVPASIGPTDGPSLVGDPLVLASQLLSTVLFAAAAAGFARRAKRTDDDLTRWLAVAAILGGFARLNYFLFPSLYTAWFYAGDGLRLASFLALLAGGMQETRRLQIELAASAVIEERRRIARELHDGVTQDLAFVVQQLRYGTDGPDRRRHSQTVIAAAERALDESRNAIAALVRGTDVSLADALAATAREAGEREGGLIEMDVVQDIAVPAGTQQELLRVVREAVINAVRHGHAQHIRVELRGHPCLCVSVQDDGRGFDVRSAPGAGRHGLEGMAARVASIGGHLSIESSVDRGTEVRVILP